MAVDTARLYSIPLAALLVVRVAAQPVNDNYANASLFDSASNSVAGTIVGATREAGEYPWFGYSVWWRWTAPTNGVFTFVAEAGVFRPLLLIAPSGTNLLIGLTNSVFPGIIAPNRFATEFPISAHQGTEYTIALFTHTNSPVIGDYTLSVVASAPPVATFVQPSAVRTRHIVGEPLGVEADAHDADGQVVRVDFFMGLPLLGSASSPPFRISASTTGAIADRDARLFAVAVDNNGLFGVAGLVVSNQVDDIRYVAFRQPPVSNNSFAARAELVGDAVRLEANNGGADREAGEPTASGEQTLWWSWTAPASKTHYILARGFLSFPRLSVFTGNTLATLNLAGSDENSSCNLLFVLTLPAQAGQTYAVAVGDSCGNFGGPFTLHILPVDAPAQIADARIRKKGEFWNVPVFELLAVGMREFGGTVEYSDDLQSWTVCDDEFPYGWADGVSNWADVFHAPINPTGSSRFYRLHRL
jgi:hypothetical protein